MTMARRRVADVIAVILATTLWASSGHDWNALGHKVVAEIAWRELDPATRQSTVETLRRHPRFDDDFAAKMTDDVLRATKQLKIAGSSSTQQHGPTLHVVYQQGNAANTIDQLGTTSTCPHSWIPQTAWRWKAG
jgi:hypothetical protein